METDSPFLETEMELLASKESFLWVIIHLVRSQKFSKKQTFLTPLYPPSVHIRG